MSNDIRLDIGFLSNLKTRKLMRELGDHGVVCMIRLWSYVAHRHPKGHMNGTLIEDLEDIAGWTGEKGLFASYATRMRWVDVGHDGSISIHDWAAHQPWIYHSDKRSYAARVGATAKWEKIRKQVDDATRIRPASDPQCSMPSPSPSPKDQKKSQKRVTRTKNVRFTPPTIEEVEAYCESRGNSVDPIRWHAHYTANGWMVGKNKMKNWKAAVVTWERN